MPVLVRALLQVISLAKGMSDNGSAPPVISPGRDYWINIYLSFSCYVMAVPITYRPFFSYFTWKLRALKTQVYFL
jgi:hypothetical protein